MDGQKFFAVTNRLVVRMPACARSCTIFPYGNQPECLWSLVWILVVYTGHWAEVRAFPKYIIYLELVLWLWRTALLFCVSTIIGESTVAEVLTFATRDKSPVITLSDPDMCWIYTGWWRSGAEAGKGMLCWASISKRKWVAYNPWTLSMAFLQGNTENIQLRGTQLIPHDRKYVIVVLSGVQLNEKSD